MPDKEQLKLGGKIDLGPWFAGVCSCVVGKGRHGGEWLHGVRVYRGSLPYRRSRSTKQGQEKTGARNKA